jgi:hypothetical protein
VPESKLVGLFHQRSEYFLLNSLAIRYLIHLPRTTVGDCRLERDCNGDSL